MSNNSPDTQKRRYDSSRRARQAAQTREEVVRAAIATFSESGWAGTTVAALAARGGVAVETIYSGFGAKKGLLRAAMDAAVVGDTDDVPFVERREFSQLGEGPTEDRIRAMVTVVTDIHVRSAPVWRALVEAAPSDTEIEGWRLELESNRRTDLGRALDAVLGDRPDAPALDLIWALFSPEVFLKLTVDAAMSRDDYQRCLETAVKRLASAGDRAD